MKFIILILIVLSTYFSSFGQSLVTKDCYEIKYMDFFGLENQEIVKWPESEIRDLTEMDFKDLRGDSTINTSFLIPLIVSQLRGFHPNCVSEIDINYFNQICDLYFKIRVGKGSEIVKKPIADRIDLMRNDFYEQVENDDILPYMIFTMDDGPFYGVDFQQDAEFVISKTVETNFGSLSIGKAEDKIILVVKNKEDKILWQKHITGLHERSLSELHFDENPMEYSSLAVKSNMHSEGERLSLYLKKDGSFLYYYHSW